MRESTGMAAWEGEEEETELAVPPGGLTVKDTFTRCHLKEPLLYFSASAEVAWPSTSLFILLWDSS